MLSEGKTLLVCGTKPTPISTSWLVRRLVMSRSPSVTDARVHLDQAEHRLQQRRLAGAVRADDADHLAGVGDQAAPVEDVDAGDVARDDVLGLDDRLCVAPSRHRRCCCSSSQSLRLSSAWRSASSAATSSAISSSASSDSSASSPRSVSWCAPR